MFQIFANKDSVHTNKMTFHSSFVHNWALTNMILVETLRQEAEKITK